MENKFSFLDIQFIRASLSSKSDDEIAAILELPVHLVTDKINEITGGAAADRSEKINQIKNQQLSKDKEKEDKKQQQLVKKVKQEKENKERAVRMNKAEERQAEKKRWEGRQKYKTRDLHLDQLVSVKIDNKTTVLVKPGTDIEQVIKQYYRPPVSSETFK